MKKKRGLTEYRPSDCPSAALSSTFIQHMALQFTTLYTNYRLSLLSHPQALQLSPDVPGDAGFLCDKAAVLGWTKN
jgi:hypothetical protein